MTGDQPKPAARRTMADFAAERVTATCAQSPEPLRFNRKWLISIACVVGVPAIVAFVVPLTHLKANEKSPRIVSATHTPDIGKWQIARHKDPMTDESVVMVGLVAEGSTWSDPRRVMFAIRCDKSGAPIMISWNRYLGGEKAGEYVLKTVWVRKGNGQPKEETWSVNPDGTSTIRPGPNSDFAMAMRTTDRLVAQIEPYMENPLTVTFDTRGMTEALKQARPECEWYLSDVLREEFAAKKAARGEAPAEAVRSWHTPK